MGEEIQSPSQFPQQDFEKLTSIVSSEFQIEEALLEHNVPTYYLTQPQETKNSFLKVLSSLDSMDLIALLRRKDERIFLKIIPKPPVKRSNIIVNWMLFFATVATTFITGYILSFELVEREEMLNPFVGGATFMIAILAVLGMHELGHKLTADKKGMDATPPYFIPGPPPISGFLGIGTFGALIMQKSLPRNRDALFDVGANGPIIGFVLAVIVSIVGLLLSPTYPITEPLNGLPAPLIFQLFAMFVVNLPRNYYILLHPVAFAGWVGMIVTMLNLLPAATLDGGHVARSFVGERTRVVLTFLSLALLVVQGFWPMAVFVLLLSMQRHPGPLDDVSSLSFGRKLLTIALVAIFVLCSFPWVPIF
ncbi:site-2 protease family protein [Candidatus Bathyarchaeota archaeon]|nr:site-2 protease family protein [Candidatus Bathyarchaeota archaeon]